MKIEADALLFDNDGTLVSSVDSALRCWTRWAQEAGLSAADFAGVPMHGRPSAEIVADLVPAAGVAAAVARIEDLEVEAVGEGVEPVPGALALLGSLADDRWAVVTSASRRLAEARLAAVGIVPATVIAADDITRGKPDPEPFLLAAARLGVAPERCVVFEDAPAGLASGRAAGMRTVALTTSHPAAELTADAVVADLTAVSVQVNGGSLEIQVAD
ncbi:HAD-IA family hydrolase [Streptomyces sp. NPDC058374]|uniref:HAD-IA family hydrolase n=1 Tax=unclassified Streptomyces TaxID=2593676 RepID=UPI00364C3067